MRRRVAQSAAFVLLTLGSALAPASPPPAGGVPLPTRQIRPFKEIAADRERVAHRIAEAWRDRWVAPWGGPSATTCGHHYVDDLADVEEMLNWSTRETDAKLDQAESRAHRVAILAEDMDRLARLVRIYSQLLDGEASNVSGFDLDRIDYRRLVAEERLARELTAR